MITEDQLEQLAIQWFEETGWTHLHGAVIAPEGVAAEREALRTLTPALCLRPSPLRSGSHGEREEDGRLGEAVRRLNPKLPESAVEEVER
jgi:type I restriction enzyme R subunit